MRQNRWLKAGAGFLLALATVVSTLWFDQGWSQTGQAEQVDTIQQLKTELEQLDREIQRLNEEQSKLQGDIEQKQNQLRQHEVDLLEIERKIYETNIQIEEQKIKVDEAIDRAAQAASELKEAEEQLAEREDLLKTRVRAMYESGGEISYLEVLLGSSSFGDFLNRLEFLSLIVQQDQRIIESFIEYKLLVEKKKQEADEHQQLMEEEYAKLNELYASLEQQQKDKQVMIASVQTELEQLAAEEERMEQIADEIAAQRAAKYKEYQNALWDGEFAWPVPGQYRITSYFGLRTDPFTGQRTGHNGMDIGAPQGTSIVAAADGIVITSEYVSGYGNTVIIMHSDEYRTLYGHIREGGLLVSEGQQVRKGEKIAEVGSTGRSTGPHLHFEVHKNGQRVDPLPYLKND